MTNQSSTESDAGFPDSIPEPEIRRGKWFSIVWLIPLIAILVGGWLAVKAMRESGPTITIVFKSAEGLVPGKTEIKYKDVTVGKVETIQLSEDLSQVLVTSVMSRDVSSYLTHDTLFWVVRARVAVGEVSGINTLFSGAYIGMAPGKNGKVVYRFEGQEKPPAVSRDTPGQQFHLRADQLGSLDIGSPVYYRQVKVGRVTNVDMAQDGTGVLLEIFIQAPYHHQVKYNSRFYNASGLNMDIGTNGVRIDTPSLASLLVGGISFFTAEAVKTVPPVAADQMFTLYESRDAAIAAAFSYREYYLLYFDETVRGLTAGAPVEFSGIKIGEVVSVRLLFDQDHLTFRIPVLIAIEPDRFEFSGALAIPEYRVVEELVKKGLRAQQRTGNLLTGQSYVCLNMYPDAAQQDILTSDTYPILPTVPSAMGEITTTARRLLDRFNRLPLEATLKDIRTAANQVTETVGADNLTRAIDNIDESFAEFKKVTADFNNGTLAKLDEMLDQARQTLAKGETALAEAGSVLGESAPMVVNLNRLLMELQDAARTVQALADYLERHPDAIVYGKGLQE
ncbi:paraquat-inducible protein B [Desulfosarcina ovata subsp. sediminis]|uniref:Paraquat-inducible protein B n=1 Tax=Desulfosarcina ovata subsp. sediminis TaxID=885957 RepID=A0A5K7ZL22_9BACT|nr:MlaD family protein [Desulfosarcina ovata]BBO80687.1 paraquat-inducible protein B [Desulfosarcina ovata subsp. sediminis]